MDDVPEFAGCYRFGENDATLAVPREFRLDTIRGSEGYERRGWVLRPRGPYPRALWFMSSPDSVVMVWARVDDRGPSTMIFDGTTIRAAARGDSLIGEVHTSSDVVVIGARTRWPITAARIPCAELAGGSA